MQTTHTLINTSWRVREVPSPGVIPHNQLPWLPAQIPGHVHLDLMRAGVIPDPFARLYERDVAWVDETDWQYETTFQVDDAVASTTYLVFHGLDTIAEIELNGAPLGQTDNMYVPHEFPVGNRLRVGVEEAGQNILRVTFRSALRIGRERKAAWEAENGSVLEHWDHWSPRSFVRKAQYMYGWDWGPSLLSCGIWRPVELVQVPVARLLDWKYDVRFTEDDTAIVTIDATVERAANALDTPLTLTTAFTTIAANEGYTEYHDPLPAPVYVQVETGSKHIRVGTCVTINNPRLWWPNNADPTDRYLHPTLYTLEISLVGSAEADKKTAKIGLRTLELIREADVDGQGEGFKLRVNGMDIFAKGANWIPAHSFPSRLQNLSEEEYHSHAEQHAEDDSLLDLENADQDENGDWWFPIINDPMKARITELIFHACDAGFNMLRVWGGGLYESEHFYELCDQHGILVWQDFPYACAYYPDTSEYAEAARKEAMATVRRIRNHPSLALWGGNNENSMMFHDGWGGQRPSRLYGERLYQDVLPSVVQAEDPTTPYWPSSPFGGDDPNSPDFGDCHNWDVWHGRGDWTHYPENDARFVSEFGFASSCGLAAWETCLAPPDKSPHSPVVRWHDKTRKGYETYLGYVALHYPEPQSLEDLVYYTQINQAEALKYGIEHYRRRKGRCWGTLFWQLNDCWPTQSWAVIDSEGEAKAAYFWAKKFYAPTLLSLVRQEQTVEVHMTSDLLQPLRGIITLTLATFDGDVLQENRVSVSVQANGTAVVANIDMSVCAGRERDTYGFAEFTSEDGAVSAENFVFFAEPKDWRLSDPGLSISVEPYNEATLSISLSAKRFAPYIWLHRADNAPLAGVFDNFFHLRPGESRRLLLSQLETTTAEELRAALVVRSL